MRELFRSPWAKIFVLLAFVALTAHCGSESDVIVEEVDCQLEGFEGGSYTFTVGDVQDDCTVGELIEDLIPDDEVFGPIQVPGVDELPMDVTIPSLPLVGTVEVHMAVVGNQIRFTALDPIDVTLPGVGSVTVVVSGILCPVTDGRVLASVMIEITSTSIPLIIPHTPCFVAVTAAGMGGA